jgi:twitching motility two-component system response regulator PilH
MTTILVVDDDLTQQLIVFKILKSTGFNFIFADDGVEALKQVQLHRPDLVILDILLPKMNGYEVCRRLKSDAQSQAIPVIMCSNQTKQSDHYWGIKQGADAYLSKPCRPQELISLVKWFLQEQLPNVLIPTSLTQTISLPNQLVTTVA